MNSTFKIFSTLALSILFALQLGCAEAASDDEESTGPFTATDIEKTWTSGCMAGTDLISSATHHKLELRLMTGGTYRSYDTWYTSATCSPVGYSADYVTNGTYTVGAVISGTTQAIDFEATTSTVMPFTTQFQTDMNTDCGGTSPFNGSGAIVGNNGGTFSTYTILCMSATFPNSVGRFIYNIGTYSGGVLTLGAPAFGVPGVFAPGALPATATISFN